MSHRMDTELVSGDADFVQVGFPISLSVRIFPEPTDADILLTNSPS